MKFRHEYKFSINMCDIVMLRSRLDAVADHDEHCGDDGTYTVRSLYFDNYADKVLREKADGTDKREKFRIRYYGDDTSFIRLEKKSKIGSLCSKQSTAITYDNCAELIKGNTGFLIGSNSNIMRELYAKMQFQLLRPKAIVEYNRECYVYPPGNVRITIDTHICGSYAVNGFLNTEAVFASFCPYCILEVKYDEFLPYAIEAAVQLKDRRVRAFSKYAAVRY